MNTPLASETLAALRALDTCTVANAIETFGVRLRNEGFTDPSIRCLFPHLPSLVGHAFTLRIRASGPPADGRPPVERNDWWNQLLALPAPRVVVIQDMSEQPGLGSFLGEVHAHIFKALGCVGVLTNGSAHDLAAIESTGLQVFAGSVAVSHAYVHLVDFGQPVVIGGLTIQPGDLLHGDRHGVLSVPPAIAPQIPAAATRLRESERRLIALCQSPDFTLERLRAALKGAPPA
ncbi:demethylmenaquinone methyltransferase [Verrucomicrobiota bacterium]|nr:demethylmenaquinone methyltransferase [Verrucomicrobiota bacterium]